MHPYANSLFERRLHAWASIFHQTWSDTIPQSLGLTSFSSLSRFPLSHFAPLTSPKLAASIDVKKRFFYFGHVFKTFFFIFQKFFLF